MRSRGCNGVILITSYLVTGILITLGAVLLMRSTNELQLATRAQQLSAAFQLAEAGLDNATVWLRAQPAPPAGTNSLCPFGGDPVTGCTPTATPRGTYAVVITPDPNNPTSYTHLYTLTSTGRSNADPTVAPRVTLLLQAPTFARYAYFTNSERLSNGTQVWFTSSDHLRGPVHSNDSFNIAGSPIFDSPVTSAASAVNYKNPAPTGGNNPQFNGGLSLNVASVQLPMASTALRNAASSGGQWYQGNTTITFQSNGTMLVTNSALGWTNHVASLPSNGAIFVNGGSASVSGTLHGQLTVGASADVNITSNVVYGNDPQLNPQSTDVLGLIAERNVVIAQSAPSDLTIQASVMALNTSFTVANYQVGPPKGTLNVYGGIIQARRGAVGTFSGTTGQKLSGYSKSYQYDTRFSNLAPPFFPTTGLYQQVLWQETS